MQHQSGYLPTQCVIDGYAQGGFHFANMSHKGSVLVLPTGVYAWAPQNYDEINVSSLALLLDLPQGAIDLLIVGTGAHLQPLLPELAMLWRRIIFAMTPWRPMWPFPLIIFYLKKAAALLPLFWLCPNAGIRNRKCRTHPPL